MKLNLERIKIAVEFLRDGQSFTVGSLRFGVVDKFIFVTGWSNHYRLEMINKQTAIKELDNVKNEFTEMKENSTELGAFLGDKEVKFNLAFNYGMGSVPICYEYNGSVFWEIELK
jgi:hypothetical protein